MKTKEEMNTIKGEAENLSKRELSEQELENVAGGLTIGNIQFSGHVGKYDAVPGTMYYITIDGKNLWCFGTLIKSYEKDNLLFGTTRTHVFDKVFPGEVSMSAALDDYILPDPYGVAFSGDDVTLYLERSFG